MIQSIWRTYMPKYYPDKIYGYYLYYTEHCIVEAMHVHASDKKLSEAGSAKFFVHGDGTTEVQKRGSLSDIDIKRIQRFIKEHYLEMYQRWSEDSENGFYEKS